MSRPRPWLAVLLALVYPGLGHVYIRAWGRALLWSALAIGTALIALPAGATDEVGGIADLGALLTVGEMLRSEISTIGLVTIVAVIGFSVVDAYVIAQSKGRQHARASGETGPSCPECGRELDDDLEFCHWCTTRLDEPSDAK